MNKKHLDFSHYNDIKDKYKCEIIDENKHHVIIKFLKKKGY